MNRRHALAVAAASGLIVLAGGAAVGANSSLLGSGKDSVGKLSPLQSPAQSPATNTTATPSEITVVVDPRSGSATVVTGPTTPAGPSALVAPPTEPQVTAPVPARTPGTSAPVRTDQRDDDGDERREGEADGGSPEPRTETGYEGRDDDD